MRCTFSEAESIAATRALTSVIGRWPRQQATQGNCPRQEASWPDGRFLPVGHSKTSLTVWLGGVTSEAPGKQANRRAAATRPLEDESYLRFLRITTASRGRPSTGTQS